MRLFLNHHKTLLILFLLILIGIFLRFYDLNWGAPYYFHPDERNIASSVSQLSFPDQLNPKFFAYGGFPIYIIFFTGIVINFITSFIVHLPFVNQLAFEQAIIISRFYSATLSLLLIPLLFLIGRKLLDHQTGVLAATLGTFCVGFIQFAHFGTFEMWLTFFTLLLFWVCLNYKNSVRYLLLSGVIVGVLAAIKVSSIVLLPLPFVPLLIYIFKHLKTKKDFLTTIIKSILLSLIFIISAVVIYIIFNPYVLLDFTSFRGSMDYESAVGLGTLQVFYTGEFINSIPVIFQLTEVLPFLLNPVVFIFFIVCFFYFLYITIQEKRLSYFLLIIFFIITFFSQALLFVKWVRYLVPSIPFIILIISMFLSTSKKVIKFDNFQKISYVVLIVSSIVFSVSYLMTAYVEEDSRVLGADFAKANIASSAIVLSEVYDLGIVPFNEHLTNITLFNFYDLDNNSPEYNEESLVQAIYTNEYIILPSQRILKVRLNNKKTFPKSSKFYENLISGELGFVKIHETPCSVFCKISYLNDPVNSYEQTANVFDRPVVMIFKKQK